MYYNWLQLTTPMKYDVVDSYSVDSYCWLSFNNHLTMWNLFFESKSLIAFNSNIIGRVRMYSKNNFRRKATDTEWYEFQNEQR